jgi:hypothetical protein
VRKKERIGWEGARRSASHREMPSARLGARGLGGKKTEQTANRSHAARSNHVVALRRALDHKRAKPRHFANECDALRNSFGLNNVKSPQAAKITRIERPLPVS